MGHGVGPIQAAWKRRESDSDDNPGSDLFGNTGRRCKHRTERDR
uniref:Uncharacterized protein n=1 Tax=Arundo donax TaxID=35708 RepID=A0A0A9AUV0_ARUDO